jgi:hypothetical protein
MTIRRTARWLVWAVLALSIWVLILLAMPFVGPSGRMVAVVGSRDAALASVRRAGGALVAMRGKVVLARSNDPKFVRRLYAAGAPLVLEGRLAEGCLAAIPN